jgi:hypothetical protein
MICKSIFPVMVVVSGISFSISTFAVDGGISAELAFCPSTLSDEVCKSYLAVMKEAASAQPDSIEDFRTEISDAVDNQIDNPEFWNEVLASPAISNVIGEIPLILDFKLFDRENADSVIGLDFAYSRDVNKTVYSDKGKRELSYQVNFAVDGVVTQNSEENPRNFINARLALSGSSKPSFNLSRVVAGLSNACFDDPEAVNKNVYCAERIAADDVDKFFEPIGSAFYIDYGVDAGFEADQRFLATNQVIGLFTFIAYEDFHNDTFIGYNNIKPSLRLALETVEPNSETPRAIVGDNSNYYRASAEFSLVVPMTQIASVPYSLMFSYRAYEELSPSDVVREADLDAYQLRTYSLVTPKGISISYSSGQLPFGVSDENIVEVGYKTYF